MIGALAVAALIAAFVVVKLLARTPAWWLPGAAALAGAFVLFADLGGSSDCHGSPVCGLDAIGRFVELIGGGVFVLIGAVMLAAGAAMHRRRVAAATALPRAIAR